MCLAEIVALKAERDEALTKLDILQEEFRSFLNWAVDRHNMCDEQACGCPTSRRVLKADIAIGGRTRQKQP